MISRRYAFGGVGALVAAGIATIPASATTGVSTGLPEPGVKVPVEIGSAFEGRYVLDAIDRRARITGGQINVQYTQTPRPYLVGFAEFDSYDNDGRRALWTANLWPFSFKRPVLKADIRSQGANTVIGGLSLQESARPGHLPGKLNVDGRTYTVDFRQIPEDRSMGADLPRARLTTGAGTQQKLTKTGWGPKARYMGRYRLVLDAAFNGATAATYSRLVMVARGIANDTPTALSANLTMFMFQAQKRDVPVPAGILKIHTPGSTDLLYLTDLKSGGDVRGGKLRGGNFNGPVVGSFEATAVGDRLEGAATIHGKPVELVFQRFSKNPEP